MLFLPFVRLWQEGGKFKAYLGILVIFYLKKKVKSKKRIWDVTQG